MHAKNISECVVCVYYVIYVIYAMLTVFFLCFFPSVNTQPAMLVLQILTVCGYRKLFGTWESVPSKRMFVAKYLR